MTDAITREELHLPWHAAGSFVISRNGYASLAEFETNEEAEFVVTAANAHHELVEALQEARSMLAACQLDEDASSDLQASWDRGLAKIDAALASAEGGA